MNNVQLIGRITDDPKKEESKNGKVYARYTIACEKRMKAEGIPTADFIPCVAWGKNADFAEKYMQKGHKYAVTGSIQTGNYKNKEGKTVYTWNVLVDHQEFCESKNSDAEPVYQPKANAAPASYSVDVPEEVEAELLFV